jgi:hypothetical protein
LGSEELWDGINMKNWLKSFFGIDKLEKERAEILARVAEAKSKEEISKMSPKDLATKRGEPWVAVLDTKVNKDNVRNGFFELDWNEYFITELKKAGYGFDGDPEEEIVDRWFRDLARNMLAEEGLDASRSAGFINVNKINKNQSEVS